jgi:hypothetical protein
MSSTLLTAKWLSSASFFSTAARICCWILPSSLLLPKPWMRSSFLLALKLRFQGSSPFRAHDDVPAERPIAERLDFRL